MLQVSDMTLAINKKGWKHGDISSGNVRWNEQTGQPTAIDWGRADRTEKPAWYKGGKLRQMWRDKHLTAPIEELREHTFKIALYGALDRAEAQKNQPLPQPQPQPQPAASCSNA
jgi:hypothetical protein